MCTSITRNEQFNSYEIAFDGKPAESVRDLLKANGYRWHGQRKIWYGYKDISEQLNGAEIAPDTTPKTSRRPSLWERTRTDSIDGGKFREAYNNGGLKNIAAIIRAHLRARFPEVKFTIRTRDYSAIDCYIEASPYKRELIKGNQNAYDWRDRCDHWENSEELEAVRNYCKAYAASYNYNNSDSMTDYFDVGFYGGYFEIASDYTQTEQTPEILTDCADFAERKTAHEQAEQERRTREFEEQQRQAEIDRKRAEEQRKLDEQTAADIMQDITVTDLSEAEQIAITDLIGGIGKENSLDEMRQMIADGHATHTDAVITRKITFTSAELCAAFCNMFLRDWEFLRGMGGSATEDTRINDINEYNKLTAEQRDGVKWYACNCVAVYLGDVLQVVIDPQGYNYARYVYVWDCGNSDEYTATEYKAAQRGESETAQPFYTPAPLAEQIEAAQLQASETFTALRVDGWIITTQRITGKLISATPTEYAQYKDAARFDYIPTGKRKPDYIITHKGEDFILYRGELPAIPRNMRYRQVNDLMFEDMAAGMHAHEFIRTAADYYKSLGYSPVVDTVAR